MGLRWGMLSCSGEAWSQGHERDAWVRAMGHPRVVGLGPSLPALRSQLGARWLRDVLGWAMCLDAISRGAALGLWLAVWLPATWAEPAQHCQPQSRESSSRGKGELCQNIISPRPCRGGPVLSRSHHCAEVLSLSLSSACCCCLRKAFAKSWSPASAGAVSGSVRDRNIAVHSQGLGTGPGCAQHLSVPHGHHPPGCAL